MVISWPLLNLFLYHSKIDLDIQNWIDNIQIAIMHTIITMFFYAFKPFYKVYNLI